MKRPKFRKISWKKLLNLFINPMIGIHRFPSTNPEKLVRVPVYPRHDGERRIPRR